MLESVYQKILVYELEVNELKATSELFLPVIMTINYLI